MTEDDLMHRKRKRSRGILGRVGLACLTVLLGLSLAGPALATGYWGGWGWWGSWFNHDGPDCNKDEPPPIPEPSAALLFAAGAFVISRQLTRRRR
jgi:hypothetical protein